MAFNCKYCKKNFTCVGNLTKHQKTAKYCLKLQQEQNCDKSDEVSHNCIYCGKDISKYHLEKHMESCLLKYQHIISSVEEKHRISMSEIQEKLKASNFKNQQMKDRIIELETELAIYKDLSTKPNNDIQKLEKIILEKDTKLQEIALTAIEQKNEVITNMVKKYVKKQPRQQFDCSNVVYILTTKSLEKDRRYILGKAKNLTSRLSTYNKTDEHQVIYYQDCGDEETMNTLEPLVFKKLGDYREQANRERFILPDNSSIDLFIDTIKNCFEFLK